VLSPLGPLLEEIRAGVVRPAEANARPRSTRRAPGAPEPDLRLEAGIVSDRPPGRSRRLVPVSLALHAAFVAAIVVVPLLLEEEPPHTVATLRAFFVAPPSSALPPPPPPPPPPVARALAPRPEPSQPRLQPASFTAPPDSPRVAAIEEPFDAGMAGGVPGGVQGGSVEGVPGGVIGGVVGGLPDVKVEAKQPVRVGGLIKEPKRLKHVEPVYSEMARKARVEGMVILEFTIDPTGRVGDVHVLRGLPMVGEAAVEAVRQWVYAPTLLDGVPIPVVMAVTLHFGLKK
jgi:periplasmic protein TonB